MGRRLGLLGLLALLVGGASGCATTWVISQAKTGRPPFDEDIHQETVPLPGIGEKLLVVLHPGGKSVAPAATTTTAQPQPADKPGWEPEPATAATTPTPAGPVKPKLELECAVTQEGSEAVYRAATRYGRAWKWATAIMFLAEGGIAALTFLSEDVPIGYQALGAYFAVDALGTGILFFAPRRDIYERSERPATTIVRRDCPEGLLVELDGQPVQVDALGGVGETGDALFERHLTAPGAPGAAGPIRVLLGDRSAELPIDDADRCGWARARQLPAAAELCAAAGTRVGRLRLSAVIPVPLGALTGPPAAAP